MNMVDDALDYARSARVQCDEPSLPDLQIIALADEVERLRRSRRSVRAWCEDLQVPAVHGTYQGGYQAARGDVLRALDGG